MINDDANPGIKQHQDASQRMRSGNMGTLQIGNIRFMNFKSSISMEVRGVIKYSRVGYPETISKRHTTRQHEIKKENSSMLYVLYTLKTTHRQLLQGSLNMSMKTRKYFRKYACWCVLYHIMQYMILCLAVN